MKTTLALLSIAVAAQAQSVKVAWDGIGVTNATYAIRASTNDLAFTTNWFYAPVIINAGTNLTATITGLRVGKTWIGASAVVNYVESGPSNILLIETPPPPPNMRTMVLQYSCALTNFCDVGFFKIAFP